MRIVTLNIWQEQGPWRQRLEWAAEELLTIDPDVICLQEVREVAGSIPNQAQTLADALGMYVFYEPAQAWGGGDEGLAILSRHTMDQRIVRRLPTWEGRSERVCLGVCLEVDGQRVWVFTTHLAYRMEDGALREAQVLAVDRFIQERVDGDTVVLAGDFNAAPETDEIRFLKGQTSLDGRRTYYQDAYAVRHPDAKGPTWCVANPYTETMAWLPRDRRLDYIFVSAQRGSGRAKIEGCGIVCSRERDGVFPSDHYGVVAVITP